MECEGYIYEYKYTSTHKYTNIHLCIFVPYVYLIFRFVGRVSPEEIQIFIQNIRVDLSVSSLRDVTLSLEEVKSNVQNMRVPKYILAENRRIIYEFILYDLQNC